MSHSSRRRAIKRHNLLISQIRRFERGEIPSNRWIEEWQRPIVVTHYDDNAIVSFKPMLPPGFRSR